METEMDEQTRYTTDFRWAGLVLPGMIVAALIGIWIGVR